MKSSPRANLIILSGARGAGKTTLLQKALSKLQDMDCDIAGILSQPVEVKGKKIAIDGLDLRGGVISRLAVRNTTGKGNLKTNNWAFDPVAMRWADEVLANSTPCDLLVVDELGVLEFERGQGWLSGLKALADKKYQVAIVVIRPELIAQAHARWNITAMIEVTSENRSAAFENLLSLVKMSLHVV